MRRDCYFQDFNGSYWPSAEALRGYFFNPRLWISPGGNDNWGLRVEGLYGTDARPSRQAVNVDLRMTGNVEWGVTLQYDRWDGRIQRKYSYMSKGDLDRLGQFVRSLHGTPMSVGLFIPFEQAWLAVKEFIETDGALPTSIAWIAARDLPPETFPDP